MRQQTRSFIVEIKQSRKPQNKTQEPSIWGSMDLSISDEPCVAMPTEGPSATTEVVSQLPSERPSVT